LGLGFKVGLATVRVVRVRVRVSLGARRDESLRNVYCTGLHTGMPSVHGTCV